MQQIQDKQIKSVNAGKVTMNKTLKITKSVGEITVDGNYTEISKTIIDPKTGVERSKNVTELFEEIFCKDNNPVITNPSHTIKYKNPNNVYVEVGTSVTASIEASFDKGNYSFGSQDAKGNINESIKTPDIIIRNVYHALENSNGSVIEDKSYSDESLKAVTFASVVMKDNDVISIKTNIAYSDSANIPLTQLGNPLNNLAIKSGTTNTTSTPIAKSYKKVFYGSSNISKFDEITSSIIRNLEKSTTEPYVKAMTLTSFRPKRNTKSIILAIPVDYITSTRTGLSALKLTGSAGTITITGKVEVSPNNITIKAADGTTDIKYKVYKFTSDENLNVGEVYQFTLS